MSSSARAVRIPGPDHSIVIEPFKGRVVVRHGETVIADSRASVVLMEANHAPVHYIPREDVDMTLLERSSHASYCPYKGEAAYFHVPALGDRSANAVWTYEAPYDAVGEIEGLLAFYADRVEVGVTPEA